MPITADPALLAKPLRCLADVEEIERTPLAQRLQITNFSERMALALASRDPDDTAIFFVADGNVESTAQEVSFRELRRNIDSTAALLRAHGIGRNDVVAILLPAVPSVYWSILGAMAAAIAFPVNWMMEPGHVLQLLTEAKAKAVIALGPTPGFKIWESVTSIAGELPPGTPIWSVQGPGGERLADSDLDLQVAAQPRGASSVHDTITGDDIAAYVHSGGTTGLPKIVKLSHRNMSYRHWTLQLALKALPGEIIIHDVPMFHVGGLTGRCLPPLASGASIIIPSIMGARDKRYIANYWKFVEKYRITRLSGVPTTLAVLAKAPPQGEDLSSLMPYFITGSTAMPMPVREEFERVSGVRILNSYGMTENTASMALDPRDGVAKEGSSGIRLPYTRIRAVVMEQDVARPCGPDEIGLLQISGPGITPGYVNPAHDRAARTPDGWFNTGDLGRVDTDGYVFVTGRAKDVIIRGGHNIDPALIEDPLLQSDDVLLAAAVGKPDAYAGELPVAYVQLVPGSRATSDDLLAFLTGRVAERAAMPKEIFILDKLPLTDIGKPMKTVLRQDAAERAFLSALSQATGLPAEDRRLRVAVAPHPAHGSIVNIMVACPSESERTLLAKQIKDIMGQYSIAHAIEWQRDAEALNASVAG
ncbi:MAG TPA: acyl-CoA synthetase [Xanthobacteraceae bacterium]